MGYLMNNVITGVAKDIETIARLRPWMEEEARERYGYKGKSNLFTEYDKESESFSFSIVFDES
jgi:hypothetical protein